MDAIQWQGIERGLSSRFVLWVQLAVIALLGLFLAISFAPLPFSDWDYYWRTAHDFSRYERGGLTLLVLGVIARLDLPSHLTILAPNILAAAVSVVLLRAVDPTRMKLFSLMSWAYLVLLTPYSGVFQLDMLATAELIIGFVLLMYPAKERRRELTVLGVVVVAVAVSTRPQFFLVLLLLAGLLSVMWAIFRNRTDSYRVLVLAIALGAGAIGGFAIDSAMRAYANRDGALRTNSAVTLYSGLLVSAANGPGCGQWSELATAEMRADLDMPLSQAVIARLRRQPASHWFQVVRCKVPQIVTPPAFATWWLFETPSVRKDREMSPHRERMEMVYRGVRWVEARAYRLLTLLLYAVALWTAARNRRNLLAHLPMLWLTAFMCVHLVFEVQGRYFLSMLLLLPVLCALALRACPQGEPDSAGNA